RASNFFTPAAVPPDSLEYDSMMRNDYCPLPQDPLEDQGAAMERMLAAERIAIVGASDDPSRPSHQIAQYLVAHGKQIVPVNPNHDEVLGLKCCRSLREACGPIEVVNVFRRPQFCADVVRDAIAIGARGVWLQSG